MQRVCGLVWPVLLSIGLPLVAVWFAYPETHLPPGFGVFPPLFVENPPGFNLVIFVGLALVEAALFLFLLFPQWFGFTIPTSAAQAGSGGIAGVVLARLGSDAVFLVADVGADHTFQLPAAAQHQMQE